MGVHDFSMGAQIYGWTPTFSRGSTYKLVVVHENFVAAHGKMWEASRI